MTVRSIVSSASAVGALLLLAVSCSSGEKTADVTEPERERRIIYNFDGDSCMWTRAGNNDPVAINTEDLKTLIDEIAYDGSQVDTMLVCINAQVMYYPTEVGTMRGTLTPPEERSAWPASEQQRFKNMRVLFDAGIDPYAVMLAEAKKRGVEALLTFRMNDAHGNDFLRTKFWDDHPEYRIKGGALNFGVAEVREYVFRLIEEAVKRYDSDGIELDFQRFPTYFVDGTAEERVKKINELVERVRKMVDEVAKERGRDLIVAARIPSDYGNSPPSYETALAIGCDPAAWAKNGWVDFLVVTEFFIERYDLPIAPWKELITEVPIYGSIECTEGRGIENWLTADKYRRAAKHLWADGADGIYLFNFFTSREKGKDAREPPFEVLKELGDRDRMLSGD